MPESSYNPIAKEIAKRTGIKQSQVNAILKLEKQLIIKQLEDKSRVVFPGFGVFQTRPHKGTPYKHPNGTVSPGVPHFRPIFTPSLPFRLKIRQLRIDSSSFTAK